MSKLSSAEKNLVLGIILLLVGILLIFFTFQPLVNNLKSNYQSYLDKNAEASALENKIKSLKQLKTLESEIKQADADFIKFIPNNSEDEDVMVTLSALASDTGNSLPNFSINASNTTAQKNSSSQFGQKQLTLGLTGTLPNILKFIDSAQSLKRYNKITSIAISNDQTGNLQANILMDIYYKKGSK